MVRIKTDFRLCPHLGHMVVRIGYREYGEFSSIFLLDKVEEVIQVMGAGGHLGFR